MIKIEHTNVYGFEAAIRGMRNPMNSWDKSDTVFDGDKWCMGENDLALMRKLARTGDDHGKFARFINVTADITAPLYIWAEIDTYKVGTVRNSCSFMHRGVSKPFEINDFKPCENDGLFINAYVWEMIIHHLNALRDIYIETKDETVFFEIRQLLPQGYLQKATWQANYQTLWHIYKARKNHRLPEWHVFCDWVAELPYFKEIYLGGEDD